MRWRGKSDRVPSHSDTRVESALLVDQLTHSHSSVDSVETHTHIGERGERECVW